VVAENQIRLVVQTFRDRLFTDIFRGAPRCRRRWVFAKDDSHAEDITRIIREEFGRGNDFCQKITYKTTGKKPEDILAEFRNSFQSPHRRHGGHDRHGARTSSRWNA
jgi:type I restriction enzyme R subunit